MSVKLFFTKIYTYKKTVDTLLLYLAKTENFEILISNSKVFYFKKPEFKIFYEYIKNKNFDNIIVSKNDLKKFINSIDINEDLINSKFFNQVEPILKYFKNYLNKRELYINIINRLKFSVKDFEIFKKIDFDVEKLNRLSFIYYYSGKVDVKKYLEFANLLKDDVIINYHSDERFVYFLYIADKKKRWKFNAIIKKYKIESVKFPVVKNISFAFNSLKKKLEEFEEKLMNLENDKEKYVKENREKYELAIKYIKTVYQLENIKINLKSTEKVFIIEGFFPVFLKNELNIELKKLLKNEVILDYELATKSKEVKSKNIKIPTFKKRAGIFKDFSHIVNDFSVPLYNELDPVPFFTFVFILFFGIMFGDLGHGFLLLIIGIFIKKGLIKGFPNYFGTIIISAGISSMFFGFIFGSVFGLEHIIKPLWITPIDSITTLFGFTVGLGIILLSISIIFNLINSFKTKDYKSLVFSENGLIGAYFYWGTLTLILKFILSGENNKVSYIEIILLLILPLFLLLIKELIFVYFIEKKEESLFQVIFSSVIDTMEIVMTYFSKTISFIRVGAFTLAHFGLSYTVFAISEILRRSAIGKIINIFWLIAGTALIILLEGLIVYIQILRLNYYELFSKFYRGGGREFHPFLIK